ncbi:hypothetical protein PV392_14705, partial [Streptomyces sp. ME03-5709C]|nr:hypothetical protein [Streptomyces sp. ME03-5709C]
RGVTRRPTSNGPRTLRANRRADQPPNPTDESRLTRTTGPLLFQGNGFPGVVLAEHFLVGDGGVIDVRAGVAPAAFEDGRKPGGMAR